MKEKANNIFWGLILVVLAAVLIAQPLGILNGDNMIVFGATAIGVILAIKGIFGVNFYEIVFGIALAVAANLKIIPIEVIIMSAISASIGLTLLFKEGLFKIIGRKVEDKVNIRVEWGNWNEKYKKDNISWGLIFIAIAVLLILKEILWVNPMSNTVLIFTVLFAGLIIKGIFELNFYSIFFGLAFIAILNEHQLGIEAITPWYVLAAALLASIGLSKIFSKVRHKRIMDSMKEPFIEINGEFKEAFSRKHEDYSQTVDQMEGEYVHVSTTFGSSVKYINSDDLKNVDAEVTFGSLTVYFDNAQIPSGEATFKIECTFSGAKVYVPRNWKVINQMNTAFGGVTEKHASVINVTADSPVLIMRGDVTFAGVEIIYV